MEVAANDLEGAYIVADVVDMSTGEVLIDANSELTTTALAKLMEAGIEEFEIFFPERDDVGTVISATIRKDAVKSAERSADRNLPQAASRRSAHARYRHAAVPGHVLRPAQVRFLARGPHEVQHQAARQGRRHAARQAHARSRGFPRHHQVPAEAAQEASARWTISITWATAACAPWANCSKTSSASAWCAWSAPSKKRCRCTRKCRRPCRTTW